MGQKLDSPQAAQTPTMVHVVSGGPEGVCPPQGGWESAESQGHDISTFKSSSYHVTSSHHDFPVAKAIQVLADAVWCLGRCRRSRGRRHVGNQKAVESTTIARTPRAPWVPWSLEPRQHPLLHRPREWVRTIYCLLLAFLEPKVCCHWAWGSSDSSQITVEI